MPRPMRVSDSIEIAAEPAAIYREIADPSNMRRWSPENLGTRDDARGPLSVGDEFVGRNRRGPARWSTSCTVTAADPGERFAFRVHKIGVVRPLLKAPIATWEYTFEEVGPGRTKVTETWQDDRASWPDARAARFDKVVTGGRRFHEFQAGNIRRTLARLKSDLES
ncbi:SRPBCC family protein [Luteipulveratus halotolerans]|uniref:Polyketide cyclase n=1 Tax=Luteipulveratus halotolerans TaxID=1631356 RepID=A0A0L6CPD0_9MICO|nr:SRPBCC family protein [Luteipulveratus halotolerans]KNX39587.1 polyketide cyclase [Luteipulveratus halotolerans]